MSIRRVIEKILVSILVRLPRSWLVKMAGGRPVMIEGKTLDPQLQFLLALAAKRPAIETLPVSGARQLYRDMAYTFGGGARGMARVEERRAPGPYGDIPLRLYVPNDLPPGPAPTLVYFHGGGFVIGDLESYDRVCRYLADAARCQVLSVDYRLAPEHRFPVAIEDCLAVWRHVTADPGDYGADPARIGVGGDSAGGHLSAVVSQQAKAAGLPLPRHQLLIYPVTDVSREWASHETYAEGFLLTKAAMHWFMGHFLPDDADRTDARVSPLKADSMDGLPAATVIIAGFDPLQDEGRAYAAALAGAGVAVKVLEFDTLTHGFVSLPGVVGSADRALQEISSAIRANLVN
ncbi:alpha/beta hydrolase [Zavarzinia compransoris]|uniref:Alpha/beta hydrolase n=1 Tax=Zavarzinia compransoris TaxID=1264899 RepID=A0A317E1F4_9PROT|nr:alpha/beta hydrolase [Zavarzinia compransoris]PWR18975.1 alpha/beta hydrolase [Zavarzinia compransoris]TDP48976.1 acetyl esterase [Zavarzinia compransoris]